MAFSGHMENIQLRMSFVRRSIRRTQPGLFFFGPEKCLQAGFHKAGADVGHAFGGLFEHFGLDGIAHRFLESLTDLCAILRQEIHPGLKDALSDPFSDLAGCSIQLRSEFGFDLAPKPIVRQAKCQNARERRRGADCYDHLSHEHPVRDKSCRGLHGLHRLMSAQFA
jgi:hypothetical protein